MLLTLLIVAPFMAHAQTPTSLVVGTVFEDLNGNGLQDGAEPGLANVSVLIDLGTAQAPDVHTAVTTSTGRYELEIEQSRVQVSVDTTTLPWQEFELTTGIEAYVLSVPPGNFSPSIDFGYLEPPMASVAGIVFEDTDGNGQRDAGERGIPGVEVIIEADDGAAADALLSTVTDADGAYYLEADTFDQRRLSVNVATLPWPSAQRTTYYAAINLGNLPGHHITFLNFGYRALDPAAVEGTVFLDANRNGTQDEGEEGLANVRMVAAPRSDEVSSLEAFTDAAGHYRIEAARLYHRVSVDIATLPFPDLELTTSYEMLWFSLPPGYEAPHVTFGYAPRASDVPLQAGGGGGTGALTNAFDAPDENLPVPADLPADAGTHADPQAGPWIGYNLTGTMTCDSFSMEIPESAPDQFTLVMQPDGAGFVIEGINVDETQTISIAFTRSDAVLGRYEGSLSIDVTDGSMTLNYVMQVVTGRSMIGYITSEVVSSAGTCDVFRHLTAEYAG
ncbi:SdrD B-like domain-containing protein [Aggregatilinea lenta]|uniref:SdrD B-like domain-containing protein n=1 Tax=Aggregatilinea lenta TaxID=913108 RepID=UPI0013C2E758|nr:SdrD B-like domain-containing protein [Aggregatilinea lenta]